jgi:hypothetical protein
MRSNVIIVGGLLLFGAIVVATTHPARLNAEAKAVTERGIVTEVYQTVFDDLVVKLKGQNNAYYMDGALEKGLTFNELKNQLLYKPVTIHYPQRWTPLKDAEPKYYISKLESDGRIIFAD